MLGATLATTLLLAAPGPLTIEVPDSGEIVRVGDFRPRQYLGELDFDRGVAPIRRNAIRAYGRPDQRDSNGCMNKWSKLKLRLITADFGGGSACAATAGIQRLVITSPAWSTERGLKVGDSLDRARELYPELRRFSDLFGKNSLWRNQWALVLEPSQVGGPPNVIERLSAVIRQRKVQSLTVSPFGAGD